MITTEVNVSELKELAGRMLTLQEADSLLREISTTMLAITRERIHEEGLKADGSNIGEYSDSYLKLREANALGSEKKVKLFFTGQMQNDYTVVDISDTEYGLGFQNKLNADKADWAENGTTDATVKEHTRNVNGKSIKVKSHTRKGREGYGKIYDLTDTELEQVRAIVKEFVANTLK
jgi:hypothetical protein